MGVLEKAASSPAQSQQSANLGLQKPTTRNSDAAALATRRRAQRLAAGTQSDEQSSPLEALRAEREAGRGDSDDALQALRALVAEMLGDMLSPDPLDVVRIECMIQTGGQERPLRLHHWARFLLSLPADARAGWDRFLAETEAGTMAEAAAAILDMPDLSPVLGATLDIVRSFRSAGRPSEPEAVRALASLIKFVEQIESRPETIQRVETMLADPNDTTRADSAIDLSADVEASYRAAFELNDGKQQRRPPKTTSRPSRTPEKPGPVPQALTESATPESEVADASGGLSNTTSSDVQWFSADEVNQFGDSQKNAGLGAMLLTRHGLEWEVAWWAATFEGEPPGPQQRGLEAMADFEGTQFPTRNRIARRQRGPAGYKGYRVVSDATDKRMTAEEINGALRENQRIGVSLDPDYADALAELKAMQSGVEYKEMAAADENARILADQIEALEAQAEAYYQSTGRQKPELMEKIFRLKGAQDGYRSYAARLRTGQTNVTAEKLRYVERIQYLERELKKANSQFDEVMQKRSRMHYKDTAEIARHGEQLVRHITDLEQEKSNLETMMSRNGEPFPELMVRQTQDRRKRVFKNNTGEFEFTTNNQGVLNAVYSSTGRYSARVKVAAGTLLNGSRYLHESLLGKTRISALSQSLSDWMFETAAALDANADVQQARAEESIGKTKTMVINVLTSGALYIATMGPLAKAGGLLGAAMAGSSMLGVSTTMATAGVLMNADKSPREMITAGGLGAVMPIFGSLGATPMRQILAAFVGAAALDGASQLDLDGARRAYDSSGGDLTVTITAATKNVRADSMLTNGLLDAFITARGFAKTPESSRTPTQSRYLRVEDTIYRVDATDVTPLSPQQLKGLGKNLEVTKLNPAELESVRALQQSGDVQGAQGLLNRAQSRQVAIDELSSVSKRAKGEDKVNSDAMAKMLSSAQLGEPIPVSVVKQAGQVPMGYALSGDVYVPRNGLAAEQSLAMDRKLAAGMPLATKYREQLDRLRNLAEDLSSEIGKSSPDNAVLELLRKDMALAGTEARALRAQFETVVGLNTAQIPGQRLIDASVKPLPGGEGTVYKTTQGAAVKVPKSSRSAESLLDGIVPERYGGLGTGKVVDVVVDGKVIKAVEMPWVDGIKLVDAEKATAGQLRDFREAMANAVADDVVLGDLHSGNVMLLDNGRIAIVDAPVYNRASFEQNVQKSTNDSVDADMMDSLWQNAKDRFKDSIDAHTQAIESKIQMESIDRARIQDSQLVRTSDGVSEYSTQSPSGKKQSLRVPESIDKLGDAIAESGPVGYGGIASTTVVARVDNKESLAALSRAPEGTPLSSASKTTARQLDDFEAHMSRALADDIVIEGLDQQNLYVSSDGISIAKARAVSRKAFESRRRQQLGQADPARIEGEWQSARAQFKRNVDAITEMIRSKLDPRVQNLVSNETRAKERSDKSEIANNAGPPPIFEDLGITRLAKRTEAEMANTLAPTCATAAMQNVIRAQLMGRDAYVVAYSGSSQIAQILGRMGRPGARVLKLLEVAGYDARSAHAVAAVRGEDGAWRYLSWGRVETDWRVGATSLFGDASQLQPVKTMGEETIWMAHHKFAYSHPSKTVQAARAMFGWLLDAGLAVDSARVRRKLDQNTKP